MRAKFILSKIGKFKRDNNVEIVATLSFYEDLLLQLLALLDKFSIVAQLHFYQVSFCGGILTCPPVKTPQNT